MKKVYALAALSALAFSAPAFADTAKNYQVTGPVTELTDSKLTVQKGKEKWEINRGNAELPADVKVGSKVTVEYNMTAARITSKAAPAKSTDKKTK